MFSRENSPGISSVFICSKEEYFSLQVTVIQTDSVIHKQSVCWTTVRVRAGITEMESINAKV